MRKYVGITLVMVLLATTARTASAQGSRDLRQGLLSGFPLLTQKSVQKELKLSDDQIKKLEAALAKQKEIFQGLGDLDTKERAKKLAHRVFLVDLVTDPPTGLGVQLTFSTAGAVIATTFVSMPLVVLATESGLRGLDRRARMIRDPNGLPQEAQRVRGQRGAVACVAPPPPAHRRRLAPVSH